MCYKILGSRNLGIYFALASFERAIAFIQIHSSTTNPRSCFPQALSTLTTVLTTISVVETRAQDLLEH